MKQQHSITNTPHNAALRDLVGNAPLRETSHAAMSVANAMQHIPHKGARLMGAATAFLILCECAGIPCADLMGMARNCMNDAEGRRPEFAAVTEFTHKEILN